MVSIKALYSVLAFQALAVSAAPKEPNRLDAQGTIFYCSNTRWNGECRTVLVPLNVCHNVPSAWNDRISSIRNNVKDRYTCTWYISYNCQGKGYGNQEDADLSDGDGKYNDSISSYSCKPKK